MATELPRPGVEVVQEFASVSPTIVTPTLVPCNIAPFFEVIEVLNSDGTTNSDAQLTDPYEQLELTIAQSSFPSPRGNIDEVDVQEATVRSFFDFGGSLVELSRENAFLTSYLDAGPVVSSDPFVQGTDVVPGPTSGVEPVGGYDVDGRTLILLLNGHTSLADAEFVSGANLPTSGNVTITFAASTTSGKLTLAEVVAQINTLLPGVASAVTVVNGDVLQLQANKYGAKGSVVVRPQGTANQGTDRLGFDVTEETIAVGSGFYADDDSDGDQTTPRLKIYAGSQEVLQSAFPGTVQTALTAPFVDSNIEAGDTIVADGMDIGEVAEVETDTLTMEVEQKIIANDIPFAPRRVWVQANNLVFPAPAASSAAAQTGTVQAAPATQGFVVSDTAPEAAGAGTVGVGAAESVDVNVVIAGVAQPTFTVSSGAGWATTQDIIDSINAAPSVTFDAYLSNEFGDEVSAAYYAANVTLTYLGIRTLATNTGSGGSLTVVSSTVSTEMGFTSLPKGDVGENVRYRKGTAATIVGTTFAAPNISEFTTYIPEVNGAFEPAETITWAAAHATIALAIADWNDQAIHTEAYESDAAGVPTTGGTFFSIRTRGENIGVTSSIEITVVEVTTPFFSVAPAVPGTATDLDSTALKWSIDNNPKEYEVIFLKDEDDDGVSFQQVIDKINAETPGVARASSQTPPFLLLQSNKVGEASQLEVLTSAATAGLGLSVASAVGNGRPAPDMALDGSGDLVVQGQILRDGLTGVPFDPGFAPMLLAFKALRLDLSPDAVNPSLLVVEDTETLEAAADPISTDNPGALMMFLSLINAPSVTVAGIGVPSVTADAPDGDLIGYTKCFEFLENEEVYALATASQLSTVHQVGLTHVNSMSEPENKGERIYFFNPPVPDRDNPDILGSGTDANSTATPNEITVEVNLAPALIAAGIDPNLDINPTTGAIVNEVYLDIGGDDKSYLVQKVTAGTTVLLRTSFAAGDGNDDSFFSSAQIGTGIISDDWSVFIRGEQLLVPGTTTPDRQAIAETVQAAGQAFGFRRGFYVFPDQVAINVTGLEQTVPAYYATACIAGMVGEQSPQQGFTNFPITGLTRPIGSNDSFTNSQLNVMAAGGVYILVQDAQGAPVIARHQLSTDLTSIETRELSITKVVDYTAKFMRAGMRNFIGRSNITQPFLDNLATVVAGQLNFLVQNGVLIGADVNNIIQDADAPDTILIDVTLDVPFPANYIRLTLVI